MAPEVTILIPTFNRAKVLEKTLEAFCAVELGGLSVHLVVIDNNCSDDTPEVVPRYSTRLPISLLKEPRPGKNSALNKALRECSLKEIVVFTDDDVTPAKDWLTEIIASTEKWPGVPVFGGRIELAFPDGKEPAWACADWIKDFAFCGHRYANVESFYQPPACPFGGNYWVRRSVFDKVRFFDETIGPSPKNRIMGSETSFLRKLQEQGCRMLYYPHAVVQHRIQAKECEVPALRRRAYTVGRGQVRLHGWHRAAALRRSKLFWALLLLADWLYTAGRYSLGRCLPSRRSNCEMTVGAMMRFGALNETARQAYASARARFGRRAAQSSPDLAASA